MNAFKSYLHPADAPKPSTPTSSNQNAAPGSAGSNSGTRRGSIRSHISSSGAATPHSLHPHGDFRNNAQEQIEEIKSDIAINWVYNLQNKRMWNGRGLGEGVVLRKASKSFMSCPAELSLDTGGLFDAACELDTRVLMTVNTRVINLLLQRNDLINIDLRDGLRVQILPSIMFLANCQRHQNAAFIKDRAILVVWADSPQEVISRAEYIEAKMMEIFARGLDPYDEKSGEGDNPPVFGNEATLGTEQVDIPREDGLTEGPRKIVLNQAVLCAITIMLIIAALGTGWRQIAIEIAVDHKYLRLAFFIVVPLQVWLALFFMQSVAGSVAQLIGPSRQMIQNSKYFSGLAPRRITGRELPHVTIQCPVYKEGLYSVIDPTVKSLKAAISTYEMQGGKANIFINDDGMQIISPEDAEERRSYYEQQRIGWVARPKHNAKPADGGEAFIRAGKFKKASNMNYAMAVSARVEDKLASIQRGEKWNQEAENEVYQRCLEEVKVEDNGRTWAEGNVRIGDYILLIDSDTRVPQDCFLDAVSEMEASPQVAILQYSSGVMNVTDSFFEMGITFFTNLIYTAIRYAVANGDVAPFVGHNAILRWKALQDISYTGIDGTEKYWSECTVSEDFDMALRLQCEGYLVRLGAYTRDGFKEGVSLTVYDELSRWEKYAYGCNELIFHPLKDWIFKGPFTPLFRKFIGSSMPLPSKITIMAYIGTYYAIGSAWILTVANYLLVGWFNGYLDHYYVDSFKIYFAIIIIFNCLGNVALAILRYRLDEQDIIPGLIMNFKWVLLLTIFLGGLSLHVSQALLCHMFSIDMSWGATSKEVENTSFFEEIPKLLNKFKFTFLWCFLCSAGMIYLAIVAQGSWRIDFFTPIWPLTTVVVSHFLLPIVLNPSLMLFTW